MSVSYHFLKEEIEAVLRYLKAKDSSKGRVLARRLESALLKHEADRKRLLSP